MTEQPGTFAITTRVLVTAEQREKLELIAQEQHTDLAEVVSHIVGDYLETLPQPQPPAKKSQAARNAIRQRRAELARLRARRDAAGTSAPAWLSAYISDIEADIRRLEQ